MTDPKLLNVIGDIERCIYYLIDNPTISVYDCPWTKSSEFRKYINLEKYKDKNLTFITEDLLMQSHYLFTKLL